ncbi:hypothetical protein CC80DRAFT_498142 [Byssothecium circinans]|uniref:Uncharacterized protein n=1 Tax=Byssothecium circinans TaxID=147558 RepID=A0A6A5TCU3_9PLEO|nr:hypothetical protein CC80DRAFT_498142 [Byssothecium circinans]
MGLGGCYGGALGLHHLWAALQATGDAQYANFYACEGISTAHKSSLKNATGCKALCRRKPIEFRALELLDSALYFKMQLFGR